ncbi:hypothetical protein [Planococcus koreensis]|uniref:hypothetical protein n=1 Tax=Planococcus koreensis TaxID=112331 RepID=UPI0010811F36|nr:hypothetical protein [Planococcus koreensis]
MNNLRLTHIKTHRLRHQKAGIVELAYDKTPVASVKQILVFMDIVREDLPKVQCPALIFVSPEDHVVPPQ